MHLDYATYIHKLTLPQILSLQRYSRMRLSYHLYQVYLTEKDSVREASHEPETSSISERLYKDIAERDRLSIFSDNSKRGQQELGEGGRGR